VHSLDELDGGFAAPGDGRELVKDEGGVLTAAGLAQGGVVGEVLQQQPHAGVGVLAAGQVRRTQVGEVDVLEAPTGHPGVEAARHRGEKVGESPHGALDRPCLVPAPQAPDLPLAVGVVLVQPHQQLGVHASHQLLRAADRAVLPRRIQGQPEQKGGHILVVGLGPAQHGHQPVVQGGRTPPPAVHRQLRPQGDLGVRVAPQISGQGTLDQARVGALAVDQEELAAGAGGRECFAFDVGGLAGAAGTDDQPGTVLHGSGDDDQAPAVGPAQVAVDLDAKGDGAEVVVAHHGSPAHRGVHAPGGLPLLAADLGRVDGLPPPGQVQGGGEQADRDSKGELRPQERSRHGQVHGGSADLAQPADVAGEVMCQGRPRAILDRKHGGDGGRRGEGQLPPADARHPQQGLAGGPGQQRHGAKQEQGQGDKHRQVTASRWASRGRRWPSWLSYSGRPCPQPQVGWCRPQRGSLGCQPPQLRGSSGCQLMPHHPARAGSEGRGPAAAARRGLRGGRQAPAPLWRAARRGSCAGPRGRSR
jgi:hypothetical protein